MATPLTHISSRQMRAFTKRCREPMFSKPYRSLLKRIDEHATFVRQQRQRRPNLETIASDEAFDKFVENYRVARLNELEMIVKATRHSVSFH